MKRDGKSKMPKGMKQMPAGMHKMPGGHMMPDAEMGREMGKMMVGKQPSKKGKK